MNEQDRIMEEKILKREKFDTFLAYMLIVILLGCIGILSYYKFIKKDNDTEVTDNNLTLTEISNLLNTSRFATDLVSDGATFSSSVSNNELVINYVKEDITLNLNAPLVGNELEILLLDSNEDIVKSIYEEIGTIICTHYTGDSTSCRNIMTNINENSSVDGIRYVNSGNNKSVYLDITKGYFVNNTNTYHTSTIVSLGNTAYEVDINDVKISNINIKNNTTNIVFTGNITTTTANYPFDVVIRLYKDDETLIKEDKVTISDNTMNTFSLVFNFDDTLKLEDLSKYSIDIVK